MNVPKVIDLVVKNDLCIGCGLCVYKCPSKALKMKWNEFGFLVPEITGNCDDDNSCISVCPFNPYPDKEVRTENEIANLFLSDTQSFDPKIGKYNGIYAGYSVEHRLTSSSGGMATYVFSELLERRIVQNIFSVKTSDKPNVYYEYAISKNKEDLLNASKTRYYPVTMAEVFSKINELEGKVAIVGVACFIKAIRLAQHKDPNLKTKIPFLVGIICGGFKSSFFTDYLAGRAGVPDQSFSKPEYRVKDLNSTAGDYSFSCVDSQNSQTKQIKMRVVGDMWGSGLFKANACDFCDDVTTELADISLGDAWIEPYIKDGKGNSVIIARSALAQNILIEGAESKKVVIETLEPQVFLSSQQGSFNHRQTGMPFRLRQAKKQGQLVPPKRHNKYSPFLFDFNKVQKIRMFIRSKSLSLWKDSQNSNIFDKEIYEYRTKLQKATKIYHYRRAIVNKSILKKISKKLINFITK